MTTQVEALAKYAARASFADLSAESRRQLPIHILDSLGCCIAALGAGPFQGLLRAGRGVRRQESMHADRWRLREGSCEFVPTSTRYGRPIVRGESDRMIGCNGQAWRVHQSQWINR
jgi:hypothetical protein